MSTDKTAQSIKNHTETSSESDKIQSKALNEASTTITTFESEKSDDIKEHPNDMKLDITTPTGNSRMTIPESSSDFRQWLQSMLAVARLPGGLPTEFRRKLWLALAERYLKKRGVNWDVEKVKWLSESWRADDEELGIQIVKDLHRTGHSLLSGASGQIYQAKLKKILMGYTRWNPEVGYCQGFNMLGAIILQVMDKCEVDSIKVMIFLIEGLLPNGYFCGGLLGLQADMAVFRELLTLKLPKLARHLHKLQNSTNEPSFEPPIINVFTMQWFLTLFCNCLPMGYVLRIWDLIMIEGSDILLRTALSIWKILEDRILKEVRTADDFYCKMGSLSAELLSGTLIDANRLIHMISTLGPISDLQQLRQKHLTASYNEQKKLKMLYSSAETDESRQAVAYSWASRRGSQPKGQTDREKIALDITILKKQYDKLRERQKQAHIILTSAVSKQHHQKTSAGPSNVNKLLVGKNAIISKNRKGPPKGAVPPVRQKYVKHSKPSRQSKPEETINWNDTDEAKKRRNSMTWKELKSERMADETKQIPKSSSASSLTSSNVDMASPKRRSDSSSYSEDSDCESSTSTSLCDDEITSSLEASPMKKKRHKDILPLDVSLKPLKKIEEVSPTAADVRDCPQISVSDPDGETKTISPIASFYLDLSSDSGDITSISQLSPMPDLSSYFTAISPIRTPCNFFEFPVLSFIMNSDEKFQVNEDGVTNEFFERAFEENVLSCNSSTSPSGSVLISKSFPSPIQEECKTEENPSELFEIHETYVSKYMKQKSLSMDEQSTDKDEFISVQVNRSFSDGTIINTDGRNDGLQKMIAENLKILNKITPRSFTSPDNANSEMHLPKLNIDSEMIEEMKSPSNLSDVEEEIAAIDGIDESDEVKEGVLLSDIQDISEYLVSRRNENQNIASRTYNTNKEEENVTERVGKSITDENEARATLACISLENKPDAEGEGYESIAATVEENPSKAEVRKQEEKSESPKFNEIQLMVTKLKEEMESQLKLTEKENCDEITKKSSENVDEHIREKAPESSVIKQEKLPIDNSKVTEKAEVTREAKVSENRDLEKQASEPSQKIDKSDSEAILEKLNTQLETCQKPSHTEESSSKEIEKNKTSTTSNKALENNKTESSGSTTSEEGKRESKSVEASSQTAPESVKSELEEDLVEEKPMPKKDSNEILENLNIQLQRYEETSPAKKAGEAATFYSISDKSVYDKSAVMELAVLIKERELEKLAEQKSMMKTSKDFDYDLNLSPVRTPRARSNLASPEPGRTPSRDSFREFGRENREFGRDKREFHQGAREYSREAREPIRDTSRDSNHELIREPPRESTSKYNNYFYDHEPRNDVRRRDVLTLETEQRMRRPFKSSPTSSLSSSPSNISNTLSSIQNTIKILDSACQKVPPPPTKYDRALENIEKICETDKDWKSYKSNKYESSPSFKIDDHSSTENQSKRRTFLDDEIKMEKSFEISSRKKRYDYDLGESSYRSSKETSPSRYSKTPEIDPDYVTKLKYLSTEEYIAGRKSPLGSRELLEPKFRIDRSPTSPVLSSSVHVSRSPRSPRSPSHTSALLRFPPTNDRSSKSAENSPSRYSSDRFEPNYKFQSTIDSRADSLSNLSCRQIKNFDKDWETPLNKTKTYDFYRN